MARRNRILFEHRERIVRSFEDVNEDYLTAPYTLGINRSTVRSIVSRYVREDRIAERPRGGPNHVSVDNEMRDCLIKILNENCLLTLTQLNQELRQRLSRKPRICDRTVAKILEGMLLRIKLARPVHADRNRPDVIQKRLDYANWFIGHAMVNHTVFIDECGYNIWTSRSQGRARTEEERNAPTDRSVVSEKEMLLSQWHFTHQWFGFPFCSNGAMNTRRFLMTSWHRQY